MPLDNLRARLADFRPLGDAVGTFLLGRAQQSFRNQGRNSAWPERAVPNRIGILLDLKKGTKNPPERRWTPRPAAEDTKRLLMSLAYRLDGNSVVVGSNLDYASDVQLGSSKTIELTADLRNALAAWLRKLSGSAKRAQRNNYPAREARYQEARAAFGPLFRLGALSVTVPPRPFLGVDDRDRGTINGFVASFIGGTL